MDQFNPSPEALQPEYQRLYEAIKNQPLLKGLPFFEALRKLAYLAAKYPTLQLEGLPKEADNDVLYELIIITEKLIESLQYCLNHFRSEQWFPRDTIFKQLATFETTKAMLWEFYDAQTPEKSKFTHEESFAEMSRQTLGR